MKSPSTLSSVIFFVFTFLIFIHLTDFGFFSPTTSSTTLSHIISIFSLDISFFCNSFSALKEFLLCISFTFEANLVRKIASSTAALPPPTTATSLSLKKKPSHVAHAETPNPLKFCSESKFNHLACAPVEIIKLSAL